jgi:hypothetical protein
MDRPADIDAAIDLMARARNHLDGRSVDTLEPALVRDLVSALTALVCAVDRHRPEVRGAARRELLDEMESARRSRAKLTALVEHHSKDNDNG